MLNSMYKVKGQKRGFVRRSPFGVVSTVIAAMNLGMLSSAAYAQEQEADIEEFETLETIVVYGAKNTKTLKDSLTSIGIVSASDIEDKELRSFRDAFRTLGNVMDSDWNDSGFIIRGVNSEGLTPGASPLATLYIDGVAQTTHGARRGARGLWDVQQVEVYRGPQSTISGRASLAGAIYIKTADPSFDWDVKGEATFGNLDTKGGALAFGGPLIEDQVAFRMAAEYSSSKNDIDYPTFESLALYDRFIEDEYYQVRGKILVAPSGMPDTTAVVSYSFSHDSPHANEISGPFAGGALSGLTYDDRRGDGDTPDNIQARVGETENVSLTINHDFSSDLALTILSSYSDTAVERPSLNARDANQFAFSDGAIDQKLFTQEIRLNYTGESLDAVFGLYYADGSNDSGGHTQFFPGFDADTVYTQDVTNYSAFGELTYEFSPGWKVIVGGRADKAKQTNTSDIMVNSAPFLAGENDASEFNFLPKFAVMREIGDDHTLGFSVQKGFRIGGAGVVLLTLDPYEFDTETTWTYELSYKGTITDGLDVTANAFYTDWKNMQVELELIPGEFLSAFTTNAASSTVYGLEVEGRYTVSEELSFFASIGHVITEFEDFTNSPQGDLAGFQFPQSAKWNMAFGGNYEHESGFHAGADISYTSSMLSRFGRPPHDYLPSYWVANARIGYRMENWDITVFAENLFDNEYFVYNDYAVIEGLGADDVAATLGARRLIGVSIGFDF